MSDATDPGADCVGEVVCNARTGDSTGGRAQIEQIVDVPVPQILEQSVEVIKVMLQEQSQ